MMRSTRSRGARPRRSATPYSVMITMVSCSVWSMCEAKGTIAEIAPSFATDGETKVVIAVTGEVTRATGAVHDAGAANVGGVDVAVDISLNHAVGRNQADATNNLWVVRNLLRTQDDAFLVALRIFVHLVRVLRRQSEGGCRSYGHLAGVNQV